MKILKKSKSLNTKMDQRWLDSAGIKHFWMNWRFKFLITQLTENKIQIKKKVKKFNKKILYLLLYFIILMKSLYSTIQKYMIIR